MRGKRLRTKREALEFQTLPRTPRWEMSAPAVSAVGMREPRKCGEEPRAVRPPPLPPSSPAPRQYARELMTTGEIITQLRSTGISRTNKPGVARILRALRGQFLVTFAAACTASSLPTRRRDELRASGAPSVSFADTSPTFGGEGRRLRARHASEVGTKQPHARRKRHPPPPCFAWTPASRRGIPPCGQLLIA